MPQAYRGIVSNAASTYGVPEGLIASIIKAESSFNPKAKSSAGAAGLMQLMPGTASGLGVKNVYDPTQNVNGGTKYIAGKLQKYGDPQLALAAYNWGPGNVDKAIKKYGNSWSAIKSHAPKETQNYVSKVIKNWRG
ncbi:lytic transglycosylase domain-containing protein [Paenibacillus rhizolycopersici]|uniref:lytic transglycosylase domain-containing protein n=1 Tax=Paenibacillus rhizolycopersici TaxID=2780073 RepID=UPI003D29E9D6